MHIVAASSRVAESMSHLPIGGFAAGDERHDDIHQNLCRRKGCGALGTNMSAQVETTASLVASD
jgi:hypothetical protein